MSADHRKPVVAFVVLALAAVLVVGVQRADAQHGRLLAAVIAVGGDMSSVRGLLPEPTTDDQRAARARVATLGPAFEALLASPGTEPTLALVVAGEPAQGAGAVGPAEQARDGRLHGKETSTEARAKARGAKASKSKASKNKKASKSKASKSKASKNKANKKASSRTTGKPAAKGGPKTVTWSDGTTRPGARPTPGAGTSTRPSTVTRPSQARAAHRDGRRGSRSGTGTRRGR